MSDEEARAFLHQQLAQAIGERAAAIQMAYLLPDDVDVATRDDVHELRQELGKRLDGVESRLDGVESRLDGVESRLDGVESELAIVKTRLAVVESGLVEVKVAIERSRAEGQRDLRVAISAQTFTIVVALFGMVTFLG